MSCAKFCFQAYRFDQKDSIDIRVPFLVHSTDVNFIFLAQCMFVKLSAVQPYFTGFKSMHMYRLDSLMASFNNDSTLKTSYSYK